MTFGIAKASFRFTSSTGAREREREREREGRVRDTEFTAQDIFKIDDDLCLFLRNAPRASSRRVLNSERNDQRARCR